jgi:hypothetical protein
MQYRKATEEEAGLDPMDKLFFLIGVLIFFSVLVLARQVKDIYRFLPAILLGSSGLVTEFFAFRIIAKQRHDKEDKIAKKGFLPILWLAYVCLGIIAFLLLFLVLLIFLAVSRHGGKLGA